MKKLLALLLSIVMAITMFGGCSKEASDEDDKSEKKQTVSIKGNKEDNEDKEANEGKEDNEDKEDNNKNTHKKEIVVGYTIYEPMNYKDDDGNLVGFDTELAVAVFEGLGYTVSFKEIDWSKKYDHLNDGTIDCVWNGFIINFTDDDGIPRTEKVDYSYYYCFELLDDTSSEAEYYAVAFKKGSALTAKVNNQLEKLAKDGTIARLGLKYDLGVITDFSDQKK